MRKKNCQSRDNVLSFGPRFSWRQNLQDMKGRTDELVSMAVMTTEIGDTIPVSDLRVVMLKSGPRVNRGVVCKPYLDDSGDLKIGDDVIYTIDNRCPPKGKAQAYRLHKLDPARVFKKSLQGTTVELTDKHLRAKTSGSFNIRISDGWVQLVVGKFRPYSEAGGQRVATEMPDVAYAFSAEELLGDNPSITLNVTDDVVSKISKVISEGKPSILGKRLEYAEVTAGTPLAILNRPTRVAVGQPFFDSFPGDSANSERVSRSRPETLEEAQVLNAMVRCHNHGDRPEPEAWKFNILLKDASSGEFLPHGSFPAFPNQEPLTDETGNPILFLDCSSFSPFWVKMRSGYAAILPPMKAVSTLYMNGIVVSFDVPVVAAEEKIEPIKPVTA